MSGSNNPVLTLEVDDAVSPGAQAAADALNKVADSAELAETKVTRVGASAAVLASRLDPATKSATALERAQNALATQGEALRRGLDNGSISQEQYSASMATLQTRVRAASDAMTAAGAPADALVAAHGRATNAANMAAGGHAGFYRELVVLGHEMVQGNYSRLGGSMMVLAERSGNLEAIIKGIGSALIGWPGLAAGAAVGLGILAVQAEHSEARILALQTALRGTRTDFEAMAAEANNASRGVAATGLAALPDTTEAAKVLSANPAFRGTEAQLKSLIVTATNLGVVMGETLPAEAAKLAAAMDAPGKMAEELATKHFPGMSHELARSIELMADGGDKANAYATLLGVVQKATEGAAKASKTDLQVAIDDLHAAFIRTNGDTKTFADVLGKSVLDVAAGAVEAIAQLVHGIDAAYEKLKSLQPPPWITAALINQIPVVGNLATIAGGLSAMSPGNRVPAGTVSPSIAPFLASAAAANGLDPELLNRLQMAEGVQNADGSWQVSPTGAIGPMQVTGSTFRGIQRQPGAFPTAAGLTNNSDPAQNIQAGAALFAHLLNKYGDPTLAVLAYHDGEPAIDQVLSSGGNASASPEALAEARRVTTGYRGTGLAGVAGILPPTDVTASRLLTDDPKKQIDDALTAAKGAGASGFSAEKATADIKLYTTALHNLADQGETSGTRVNELTEALTKAQHAFADALSPAAKLLEAIARQTAGENEITAAWANGAAAAADATAHVKAEAEARAFAVPGTVAYADAVARLTAAHIAEAAASQNNQGAQALYGQSQTLEYLRAEAATLGQSTETRTRMLAVLKEQQTIDKTLPLLAQSEKDALLAGAAAIADQQYQLQQTQAAFNELGNLATQAFDQVGQAITQAFVSGQGAAVNWGNVTRGVVASVLQEIVKLAIINPLLNGITGGNRVTLGGVVGALSGGDAIGGAAGGTSALGMLSTGSSAISGGSSLLQALGYQGIGGQINGLLGGPGTSLLAGTSLGEGVGSILGGSILGTAGLTSSTTSALAAMGATYGPATAAQVGIGATTIGSALGGVGGGFALGSLSGSLIQGALNKTGPAPEIGAAVGAVSGAIIGSVVPGLGTVIGGLIGGLIGGSGGGLIGPGRPNPYSGTAINISNGMLGLGQSFNQGDRSSRPDAQLQTDTLNAFMMANGLTVTSLGNLKQIGQNTAGNPDPTKYANLGDAFSGLRFGSSDSHTNAFLTANGGAGFATVDELNAITGSIKAFVSALSGSDFASRIDDTLTNAEALGSSNVVGYLNGVAASVTAIDTIVANKNTGALAKQVADLQTQFDGAAVAAQQLGYKEADLAAARDKAITAAVAAVNESFHLTDAALVGRAYTAYSSTGQVSGQFAALFNFDLQADQQRVAFDAQLTAAYGDAYKTSAQYAQQMGYLEQALGAERLAIAQQYADKLNSTATGTVQSLANYATKLATGSASPLSPTAQYAFTAGQFHNTSAAAGAGSYADLTGLPSAADSFLAASRVVNGSGAQYAADFASVESALEHAAAVTPDSLTASIFVSESRTSTQILSDALAALKDEVVALRAQVTTGALLPSRVS